jgi:hypothetical protein
MASISLPALAVKPPEQQPNALALLQGIQGLRAGQQEQQQRQIQIQNAQMQQQDQLKLRNLFIKHSGNLDKVIQDAPQAGVSPQTLQQLQLHNIDVKTKTAELVKTQGENAQNQADLVAGAHDAVDKAPAEQKPAEYQKQLQGLQARGIDISQMPPQYPGDDQFKMLGAVVKGHKQQVDDALKGSEQQKNISQAGAAAANQKKSEAETAKLQAEMNFYKAKGLAPGVPLDAQEASDWLNKNPGKSLSDFMKFKATLVPQFNFNLQNSGTTGPAAQVAQRFGMSPVSFDQAAEKYWTSGQLPPAGRGGPALALNKALMNRAAELHPEGSLAANSAEFKANQASLSSLQKNFDQVTAFENTAGKNLDVFLGTAQKVIDSGNPLINRPLRSITGGMGGTDQAAFNTARTTALTEISKVLNSSNASGVLSDSARHEVEALIGPNATLKQIVSAANILKQDMANRHDAYQQQIGDIKGRMGGKSTSQAQPQPSGMVTMKAPNGQTKQVPADQVEHYKSLGAVPVNQ